MNKINQHNNAILLSLDNRKIKNIDAISQIHIKCVLPVVMESSYDFYFMDHGNQPQGAILQPTMPTCQPNSRGSD